MKAPCHAATTSTANTADKTHRTASSTDKASPGPFNVVFVELGKPLGLPTHVALIGRCQHCGETVELIISKKQAKALWKAFKLPIQQAQRETDKVLPV